jgi:Mn2+/Fe2+ NRAMP family transporter
MKPYQATAIRVCGLATLVIVLVALAETAAALTGASFLPKIQLTAGVAVFVAAAAFILANVRTRQTAESVTLIAASTVLVLLALYINKVVTSPVGPFIPQTPSPNILDATLALLLLSAFVHMCMSVRRGRQLQAKPAQ